MGDPDTQPAGDPRDPRGDPKRARRPHRRLPRWAVAILVMLVVGAVAGAPEVWRADPRLTVEALLFGLVVAVPPIVALLWADRRMR